MRRKLIGAALIAVGLILAGWMLLYPQTGPEIVTPGDVPARSVPDGLGLILVPVYMAGWLFHRGKKAFGWVGTKRRAGTPATLSDWFHEWGFSAISDGCLQIVIAFGWAAGFFQSLITKLVPAEYMTIPAETGVLVEVALGLFAGYFGSSIAQEFITRHKAKKEAIL